MKVSLILRVSRGRRSESRGIRRILFHHVNCFFNLKSQEAWSRHINIFILNRVISQPSLHMMLVAAPPYWIKQSTSWQIFFGFVVISPPVSSHLNFICKQQMTQSLKHYCPQLQETVKVDKTIIIGNFYLKYRQLQNDLNWQQLG